MNCNEINPLLHAYVDGELDLMRSLDVERHMKACGACATARRALQSLHSTLRHSNLSYSAPASLRSRIRKEIQGDQPERSTRNSRPWLWQFLTVGAIGFTVATLMLRPAAFSSRDQLADEAISSHVRSLMGNHLMDVVSTDRHTVKPWFNGKIDFAPNVQDFAEQGFPLIGGRLDYLEGQTVAALIYSRGSHKINVFVWPDKTAVNETVEERRGYSVINREIGGLRYCIVSDLNAKDLSEFAKLLGN